MRKNRSHQPQQQAHSDNDAHKRNDPRPVLVPDQPTTLYRVQERGHVGVIAARNEYAAAQPDNSNHHPYKPPVEAHCSADRHYTQYCYVNCVHIRPEVTAKPPATSAAHSELYHVRRMASVRILTPAEENRTRPRLTGIPIGHAARTIDDPAPS